MNNNSKYAEVWLARIQQMIQKGVNFSAFDMDTVKTSLVNYVKLYYPESFNDFIESSEFIAILDLFAYIAELYAYRIDVSASENFLSTAQRKDSVLELSNFLSYNASRNMPARGLLKLQSITTSSPVIDQYGNNLANVTINWNDPNNTLWKDQWILVINDILQQPFGSVTPSNRIQVENVVFELYSLNNNYPQNGVLPFSITSGGTSYPMEIVSSGLNSYGPYEMPPSANTSFNILYGTDGLGDQSNNTGFFVFCKQGTLTSFTNVFNLSTPNQTFDITTNNINDIDVWLNQIDATTGATITPWTEVTNVYQQNLFFNNVNTMTKYQVQTLQNDNVRLLFGDGIFADIPFGTFQIWYRVSANTNATLTESSLSNVSGKLSYQGIAGNTATLQFTAAATSSFDNSSASETIIHVRNTAPTIYTTQDRMVNGSDYGTFLYQDPSVLKLMAINRTFTGASRYIAWSDPTGGYENLKLMGNDLAVFIKQSTASYGLSNITISSLIQAYLTPLISTTDTFLYLMMNGVPYYDLNSTLSPDEVASLTNILTPPPTFLSVYAYYDPLSNMWQFYSSVQTTATNLIGPVFNAIQSPTNANNWTVTYTTMRIIAGSPTTNFWNATPGTNILDVNTLQTTNDQMIILQANVNGSGNNILPADITYQVLSRDTINGRNSNETHLDLYPQISFLNNNEYISQLNSLMLSTTVISTSSIPSTGGSFTLNDYYIVTSGTNPDITVTGGTSNSVSWTQDPNTAVGQPSNVIVINTPGNNTTINVNIKKYVYFYRQSVNDLWLLQPYDYLSIFNYCNDPNLNNPTALWTRYYGRSNLNFVWIHVAANMNLIDPAPTNIIDMIVLTSEYYTNFNLWINGLLGNEPQPPTPSQLFASYNYLLTQKMISDTVVLSSASFKVLFGNYASPENRMQFKVILSPNNTTITNNIKNDIITAIQDYFNINNWNMGQTFYFIDMSTYIATQVPNIISIVPVPLNPALVFGNGFEITCKPTEIFIPQIDASMINIVTNYNSVSLQY